MYAIFALAIIKATAQSSLNSVSNKFYRECRSLIGYATHYSVMDGE